MIRANFSSETMEYGMIYSRCGNKGEKATKEEFYSPRTMPQ